jgi:hypothetical protein
MPKDVGLLKNLELSPIETANASVLNAIARIITSITFVFSNQCAILKNTTVKTKNEKLILKTEVNTSKV